MRFHFYAIFLALPILLSSTPSHAGPCPPGYALKKSNSAGTLRKMIFGAWLCQKNTYSKAKYLYKPRCPSGTFSDPSYFSNCFKCAPGYKRSVYHIKSDKACVKHTGFMKALWKKIIETNHKTYCANGSFLILKKGECWSCPQGFKKTMQRYNGTKACVKTEIKDLPNYCTATIQCKQNDRCINNTCQKGSNLPSGSSCTSTSQCRSGLTCKMSSLGMTCN